MARNRSLATVVSLSALLTMTALLSSSVLAATSQCIKDEVTTRPKIGLVLGGGGARGFAHIGVLQKLEEMRIPYDYIAGTSMGSIVGALLAVGMESDELEQVVRDADWDKLFKDKTARENVPFRRKADDDLGLFGPKLGIGKNSSLLPKGMVSGQKIVFMFESVTSQRMETSNFDHLAIPYRAIATDIVSGKMVIIGDGELSMAMRASMSVPGVFDPVRRENAMLVDGGLVRNLPVDVAKDMGADVVIAIDVGTKLADADELSNVLGIIYQMSGLLTVKNTNAQIQAMGENDILISPAIGNLISSAEFSKLDVALPLGYAAAESVQAQLEKYSLPEAEYKAWRQQIKNCIKGPPRVDFVRLDNNSRFSDEVILNFITVQAGNELDLDQLDQDLRQIYGLGFIRQARYSIVEEGDRQGVQITVFQDERGKQFIETGLDLSFSGRGTDFNIRGGYLNTGLDDRGAEFRALVQFGESPGLLADYYKPLDDGLKYNFRPGISIFSRPMLIFDGNGDALAELRLDEVGASVTLGREFGRHAAVYAGITRYAGKMDITVGNPNLTPFNFQGSEIFLEFQFDRLDDRYLPRKGMYSNLKYSTSLESLGADTSFNQLEFSLFGTHTFGLHNFMLGGQYNISLDDNTPIYAWYTGGGFLNMSGFEPNSLVGPNFGQLMTGYRYQVAKSGFLPGYVGATLEYGNVTLNRSDLFRNGRLNGSAYLAYRSPIGPVYLGIGWSKERSAIYFIRIGSIFGPRSLGRR